MVLSIVVDELFPGVPPVHGSGHLFSFFLQLAVDKGYPFEHLGDQPVPFDLLPCFSGLVDKFEDHGERCELGPAALGLVRP